MKKYPLLILFFWIFPVVSDAVYLGDYTSHAELDNGLLISAGTAQLFVNFYNEDIVRIVLSPDGIAWPESSLVVVAEPEDISWRYTDVDSALILHTASLDLHIHKHPVRLRFEVAGQTRLYDEQGLWWEGSERGVRFALASGERLYGGGERAININRRGQLLDSYNQPQYCYGDGTADMNITVPVFISSARYGIYFDNPYPGTMDIGNTDPNVFDYSVQGGELAYYFMAGNSYGEQLACYTYLTGRQPLPPRWTLGYLQSRYGYTSESHARDVVQTLRAQNFPLDAIILDLYWFGWGQMGDFDWDYSQWPTPPDMVSDFDSMNVKTILITEPYILQTSSSFAYTNNHGYLTPDASGTTVIMPGFWAGSAGLLDITDPGAQDWLWSKYDALIQQGVGGWWCDLGEPELHPENMVHFAGTAAKVHNTFSLQWAKLLYDRYREHYPDRRLFNLIRSGYAGMQRFSTFPWSGDVQRSFSGLVAQLPIMLSMSMSGVAYIGSDIGGFDCGPLDPELYIRWMQMGTFSPVLRAHGTGVPTEPIYFDSQTQQIVRDYLQLRYMMLPYNYSLAFENSLTGMPLVRPLFFEYENPITAELQNEYLWGSSLLVAPVLESGQTERDVYLPQGTWVDFWTDQAYFGGQQYVVNAPLSRIPLFTKAGSFIPMAQPMLSTAEYRGDTLALHFFPDITIPQSTYTMYEDDGDNPVSIEQGLYEVLQFQGMSGPDQIQIDFSVIQDGYPEAPDRRQMRVVVHRIVNAPDSVCLGEVCLPLVATLTELLAADSAVFWAVEENRLYVAIPWDMQSMNVTIHGANVMGSSESNTPRLADFRLESNYPNPFNANTTIRFTIPQSGYVTLKVFDVLGREIRVIANGILPAGSYERVFNADGLPSGIYFARLSMGNRCQMKKMVLLR